MWVIDDTFVFVLCLPAPLFHRLLHNTISSALALSTLLDHDDAIVTLLPFIVASMVAGHTTNTITSPAKHNHHGRRVFLSFRWLASSLGFN